MAHEHDPTKPGEVILPSGIIVKASQVNREPTDTDADDDIALSETDRLREYEAERLKSQLDDSRRSYIESLDKIKIVSPIVSILTKPSKKNHSSEDQPQFGDPAQEYLQSLKEMLVHKVENSPADSTNEFVVDEISKEWQTFATDTYQDAVHNEKRSKRDKMLDNSKYILGGAATGTTVAAIDSGAIVGGLVITGAGLIGGAATIYRPDKAGVDSSLTFDSDVDDSDGVHGAASSTVSLMNKFGLSSIEGMNMDTSKRRMATWADINKPRRQSLKAAGQRTNMQPSNFLRNRASEFAQHEAVERAIESTRDGSVPKSEVQVNLALDLMVSQLEVMSRSYLQEKRRQKRNGNVVKVGAAALVAAVAWNMFGPNLNEKSDEPRDHNPTSKFEPAEKRDFEDVFGGYNEDTGTQAPSPTP